MKTPNLEDDSVSVVLLGAFNPQIFHPAWFAAYGLIRQSEAETAKVEVVHPEYAAFATEWFKLSVSADRLAVESAGSAFRKALLDLVTGTFSLLSHTPLRTLGLNRVFHFRMESEADWHAIGHHLVPKEPWNSVLKLPGTEEVRIRAVRPDDYRGFVRAIVGPSQKIKPGLYFQVNDHYEVEKEEATNSKRLMEILNLVWQESLRRAEEVPTAIFASI